MQIPGLLSRPIESQPQESWLNEFWGDTEHTGMCPIEAEVSYAHSAD